MPGGLIVVELEGRFAAAQRGRFTRQPVLVVEPGDDRPRLELAPVRATLTDGRWRSAYAIPAEALPAARFALGLRGTLLELPAPDEPDHADRLTILTREANTLRRALEAAETLATTTRANAAAAVIAARDEAFAQSTHRIQALEGDLAAAETRAQAAIAGTEVLRAELAEERKRSAATIAELEAKLEAALRQATELRSAAEAEAREHGAQGDDAMRQLAVDDEDDDATQPLAADTRPSRRAHPAASATPAISTHHTSPRGPGPWIAVGALVLFAFVLLGLLLGFLA